MAHGEENQNTSCLEEEALQSVKMPHENENKSNSEKFHEELTLSIIVKEEKDGKNHIFFIIAIFTLLMYVLIRHNDEIVSFAPVTKLASLFAPLTNLKFRTGGSPSEDLPNIPENFKNSAKNNDLLNDHTIVLSDDHQSQIAKKEGQQKDAHEQILIPVNADISSSQASSKINKPSNKEAGNLRSSPEATTKAEENKIEQTQTNEKSSVKPTSTEKEKKDRVDQSLNKQEKNENKISNQNTQEVKKEQAAAKPIQKQKQGSQISSAAQKQNSQKYPISESKIQPTNSKEEKPKAEAVSLLKEVPKQNPPAISEKQKTAKPQQKKEQPILQEKAQKDVPKPEKAQVKKNQKKEVPKQNSVKKTEESKPKPTEDSKVKPAQQTNKETSTLKQVATSEKVEIPNKNPEKKETVDQQKKAKQEGRKSEDSSNSQKPQKRQATKQQLKEPVKPKQPANEKKDAPKMVPKEQEKPQKEKQPKKEEAKSTKKPEETKKTEQA